jgi:hypothetical protein
MIRLHHTVYIVEAAICVQSLYKPVKASACAAEEKWACEVLHASGTCPRGVVGPWVAVITSRNRHLTGIEGRKGWGVGVI